MNSTSRIARVTKFRGAWRDAAMPPAKSMWLRMTPPKMVPRALVSRGSIVTRNVGFDKSGMIRLRSSGGRGSSTFRQRAGSKGIQPLGVFFRRLALEDVEERALDIFRNRPAPTRADLPVVHFADWRQLGRRAGKKCFVGDIELIARKTLLDHLVSFVTRQGND